MYTTFKFLKNEIIKYPVSCILYPVSCNRVKDMGSLVEKNNQLLKLIVQKMEIHTEDEAWDEGVCFFSSFLSFIVCSQL